MTKDYFLCAVMRTPPDSAKVLAHAPPAVPHVLPDLHTAGAHAPPAGASVGRGMKAG